MPPLERYVFNSEQLDQYFDRIAVAKAPRIKDVSELDDESKLSYLETLLKYHIVRVPFENLTQHYSWHRVISLHPLHLHRKIAGQLGRGGYCMEANSTFHNFLRSLGFRCYLVAGRVAVSSAERWTGWSHLVNIVVIGSTQYLCDVGFGPREAIVPMPLTHGAVRPQVSPAESRLVYETLEENLSDCKLWKYQLRSDNDEEWTTAYCFSETEVLPGDLEGLNYAPWIGKSSHFTQKVISVRFTTERESLDKIDGLPNTDALEEANIDGQLILNQDSLQWRRHGETVLERGIKSEEERVEALRKYWGIHLDIEDQMAINGTVAAIKS